MSTQQDTDKRFGLASRACPLPEEVDQAERWLLDVAGEWIRSPGVPSARDRRTWVREALRRALKSGGG